MRSYSVQHYLNEISTPSKCLIKLRPVLLFIRMSGLSYGFYFNLQSARLFHYQICVVYLLDFNLKHFSNIRKRVNIHV